MAAPASTRSPGRSPRARVPRRRCSRPRRTAPSTSCSSTSAATTSRASAAPGTVRVARFLEPEHYSHVVHLVSEVVGEIQPGRTAFDLLRATFPAGTVSGAPKVRAMQIISELERYGRGTYARRRRLRAPERRPGHVHRHPHALAARRRRLPAGGRRHRRRLRPCRGAPGMPEQAGGARGGHRPRGGRPVILLVDNYDSFTYNLVHLLQELGAEVVVRRNDEIDADEAESLGPSHLVVSPGPGRPEQSGATLDVIRRLAPTTPTLGVCLGHQAVVRGLRRRDRPGSTTPARQDEPDPPRRGRHLRRAAAGLHRRPLPLAVRGPRARVL